MLGIGTGESWVALGSETVGFVFYHLFFHPLHLPMMYSSCPNHLLCDYRAGMADWPSIACYSRFRHRWVVGSLES